MNPSKRDFLGGALASVFLVSVPSLVAEAVPILYADGINDDSAGLFALATGKPFRTLDGFLGYARNGFISGAHLRLPNGLFFPAHAKVTIADCDIDTSPLLGYPFAKIQHDSDCAVYNEPAMPNGPCDCSLLRDI